MGSKLKDRLNFYTEFKEWHSQIIDEFKFDYKREYEARDYLAGVLTKKSQGWELNSVLSLFKERILSKTAILIYGCGPSLEETVDTILKKKGVNFFENFINITADGASILLRERGIKIDAIFTDLDGITKKEFNYTSFNIIHAHGDNIEKLKFFEDEIREFENIIGTTQIEPVPNLLNPGGFTDGDRILYFIRTLLSSFHTLYLIGMDFGNVIGKYSKLDVKKNQEASLIKQKKLQYAIKLIKWLKNKIQNDIYFVNSKFIIQDFLNLTIDEFFNLCGK
jgi:uncharacterized Rossmann fold enzyme